MSLTVLAAQAVHDNIASRDIASRDCKKKLPEECLSKINCFSSKKYSPLEMSIGMVDHSLIERSLNYLGIKKYPAPDPHFAEHLIDHLDFYHKETELMHYFKTFGLIGANRLKEIPDDLKSRYLNVRDNEGKTALHWAAEITGYKIPKILTQIPKEDIFSFLEQQDNVGNTPLHYLAQRYDSDRLIEIFELLSTEKKLDLLKIQNERGDSLIHIAIEHYDLDFLNAAFKDLSQNEKDLLITLQNNRYFTSLHHASKTRVNWRLNNDTFPFLLNELSPTLKTKALKMQTDKGKTALHYAAKRPFGATISHIILQEFLATDSERNDFIRIPDNKGRTALHFASTNSGNNHIVNILSYVSGDHEKKSQLKIRDTQGKTVLHYAKSPEVIDTILQTLDDDEKTDFIKIQDKNRKTALHHITERSSYQINLAVEKFLEDFSDNQEQLLIFLKQQDDQGKTALHHITERSSYQINLAVEKFLEDFSDNQEQLLIFLKQQDDQGKTALHYATNNSPEMVKIILESIHEKKDRAELIKIQDNEGRAALPYAANYADKTISLCWFLNDRYYMKIQESKYHQLYLTLSIIKKSLSTDDWNEIKKIKDKKNRNMDYLVRETFIPFVKNHYEGLKFSVCNAAYSAFYSIIPFLAITAGKVAINNTPIRSYVPLFDNNIFRYSMIAFKCIWLAANGFAFLYREKELVKNRTYKTLKAWKFLISENLNRS